MLELQVRSLGPPCLLENIRDDRARFTPMSFVNLMDRHYIELTIGFPPAKVRRNYRRHNYYSKYAHVNVF